MHAADINFFYTFYITVSLTFVIATFLSQNYQIR